MISLAFKFFGAMREYGAGYLLEVPAGSSVQEIKRCLGAALLISHPKFRETLLAQSAIGDARTVLRDSDCVQEAGELAVLPPVCGG